MRKPFLYLALLLAAVIAAAAFWPGGAPAEKSGVSKKAEPGTTVGRLAPPITLGDLTGKQVAVSQTGKITVLNFWATWCPPCREEMPELEAFSRSLPPEILFYAVNIQEPDAKVQAFLAQNQLTMPVLADSNGSAAAEFRITAIPTTLILDRQGVIQYRKSGGVTKVELLAAIKEMEKR